MQKLESYDVFWILLDINALEQWDAKIPKQIPRILWDGFGWRILRTAVTLAFWFALHKELLTNPSSIGAAEANVVKVSGPSGLGWVVQEMVRFDILGAM